jgi:hypothetical protein
MFSFHVSFFPFNTSICSLWHPQWNFQPHSLLIYAQLYLFLALRTFLICLGLGLGSGFLLTTFTPHLSWTFLKMRA